MQEQRAQDALSRIERALNRIEKAAGAGASRQEREQLEKLRSAHALLRGRVEAAIGEIDALLTPAGES